MHSPLRDEDFRLFVRSQESVAGTPQGGVCGPTLATVYLNEVAEVIAKGLPKGSVEAYLYADDLPRVSK